MEYLDQLGVLALGSRLRRLSDKIMADGALVYQQAGISFDPKWFPVFKLLSTESPLGIMEIASKLEISHPYVIKLIKSLESNGYVENTSHSKDARKRAIKLSKTGISLCDSLEPIWADISRTMESVLREHKNGLYTNLIEMEKLLEDQSLDQRVAQTRKLRMFEQVEIIEYNQKLKDYFKTLNLEWLEKYFHVEPIDLEVLSNPDVNIIAPGGAILFARYNGKIIGTCALKKSKNSTYELTKMAVTPKAQGLQAGKKLGEAILKVAKEKGATLVYLESNRKLMPALNLYKKLGFIDAISPFESDYERSDVYMELKLD